MAEARQQQVSILRIIVALAIVAGVAGTLGGAFWIGRATGAYHEQMHAWSREVDVDGWRAVADQIRSLDFSPARNGMHALSSPPASISCAGRWT